ncbi:protein shisa-4-like isoform X2 [Acanthopagrus latus]|uniref:protein shisa-4-like isoform X2 n=1 Tax=Acanthopagrus latus TaxID=8177 RepID=UPI00187CD04F|nr:protein shisa-4-like isoform X2 [Acanthopagrus latus]
MTVTQAIRSCNSQNEIRSVLMVRKSCINPSVTSLSLEERNVAELLATGWDRHTGSNGCLAVISSRRYITAAEYCNRYQDTSGDYYDSQQCYSQYCCGYCTQRYCCADQRYRLAQDRCSQGTNQGGKNKLPTVLGSTLGTIFPLILIVGVIICCVAPCCFCYKKCRKGGNRGRQPVIGPGPMHPHSPSGGYQPAYPGFQPGPAQPGFGGMPNPGAPPPSYFNNDPGYNPAAFGPAQPMYPFGQLFATPPDSDETVQPPFNPAYDPNSVTA